METLSKRNIMDKEKINLQVCLNGEYAAAFRLFQGRNTMDGRSNITTLMAILRTLPDYAEAVRARNEKRIRA